MAGCTTVCSLDRGVPAVYSPTSGFSLIRIFRWPLKSVLFRMSQSLFICTYHLFPKLVLIIKEAESLPRWTKIFRRRSVLYSRRNVTNARDKFIGCGRGTNTAGISSAPLRQRCFLSPICRDLPSSPLLSCLQSFHPHRSYRKIQVFEAVFKTY